MVKCVLTIIFKANTFSHMTRQQQHWSQGVGLAGGLAGSGRPHGPHGGDIQRGAAGIEGGYAQGPQEISQESISEMLCNVESLEAELALLRNGAHCDVDQRLKEAMSCAHQLDFWRHRMTDRAAQPPPDEALSEGHGRAQSNPATPHGGDSDPPPVAGSAPCYYVPWSAMEANIAQPYQMGPQAQSSLRRWLDQVTGPSRPQAQFSGPSSGEQSASNHPAPQSGILVRPEEYMLALERAKAQAELQLHHESIELDRRETAQLREELAFLKTQIKVSRLTHIRPRSLGRLLSFTAPCARASMAAAQGQPVTSCCSSTQHLVELLTPQAPAACHQPRSSTSLLSAAELQLFFSRGSLYQTRREAGQG